MKQVLFKGQSLTDCILSSLVRKKSRRDSALLTVAGNEARFLRSYYGVGDLSIREVLDGVDELGYDIPKGATIKDDNNDWVHESGVLYAKEYEVCVDGLICKEVI
ncbi:MAG: hypothetical protein LBR10_13165 [Prevotellaceae bacterium]|jgi:hypothetical protein|nr:hypothetical protein [Prevotellaceae bacterium]